MSLDKTRAIEKIRKCLNLSSSSNPHEAAAALARASALMRKYGVTEQDLDSTPDADGVKRQAKVMPHEVFFTQTIVPLWAVSMADYVAGFFESAIVYTNKVYIADRDAIGSCITFVGRNGAAELAAYAFSVCQRLAEDGRKQWLKEEQAKPYWAHLTPARARAKAASYYIGFSEGVCAALERMANSLDELVAAIGEDAGTGLMVIDKDTKDNLLDEYAASKGLKLHTAKRVQPELCAESYRRGLNDGEKSSINEGIATK